MHLTPSLISRLALQLQYDMQAMKAEDVQVWKQCYYFNSCFYGLVIHVAENICKTKAFPHVQVRYEHSVCHISLKHRPKCYTKSPTAQDAYWPIPHQVHWGDCMQTMKARGARV